MYAKMNISTLAVHSTISGKFLEKSFLAFTFILCEP